MTASAPVASPRLTATERALIVEVLRWGRANGWRHSGNWDTPFWSRKGVYRIFADRYDDDVLHLRIDDKVADQGLVDYWPRSVTEAVDVLAALGIVPSTLSSAYRDGVDAVEEAAIETRFDVYLDELWDQLKDRDVLGAIGAELDGILDREPFVRRRQVQRVVGVVLKAAGMGDDA